MEVEEHVDGDLAEDVFVAPVAFGLGPVVRQEPRLHVAPHEAGAEDGLSEPQERHREGHVELHPEGGGREDEATNGRRVVVDPCGDDDSAQAVGHDHHVFAPDPVLGGDMGNEGVDVLHQGAQAFCPAPHTRGAAVAPSIPGEDRHVVQRDRVDDPLPSSRVFVAAMEEEQRLA